MLHFSIGRQIFDVGGQIFCAYSTGTKSSSSTKACVTAADLIDLDGNLHCFMLPLSSCDIKISVVSWCRILVAVQYMNTQLFVFFFQLKFAPAGLQWLGHCWRWLTADSRVLKHKHKFETDSVLAFWPGDPCPRGHVPIVKYLKVLRLDSKSNTLHIHNGRRWSWFGSLWIQSLSNTSSESIR